MLLRSKNPSDINSTLQKRRRKEEEKERMEEREAAGAMTLPGVSVGCDARWAADCGLCKQSLPPNPEFNVVLSNGSTVNLCSLECLQNFQVIIINNIILLSTLLYYYYINIQQFHC